ncbi:M20/M25/M40 family metallo-hydrolase [Campylobacter sp. RM12327]|uniref:M28 family peptidase n=1 Tax=Campylobacter sputorum TaxID=206 RepID=UPI000B795510|nr:MULTISPECIES: M28 family peptidase [Campylobacter]ASM39914.1 aminoacyl-histidine dipeptidase [Campylobacter sputorum]MBE7357565.1 M20/M25/M40 family metallo-hydrolase [Campylobacter sp. RM11302]MBF6669133.1 M20/M25/M40 family metallo-hydrolase [Campylobacter sp. RM12327]MBF6674391.1 M20/M25/M40 family metallo-hydrolase [Campylobacter sp. RM13538]MBF6675432.1 M20/M25/M40 family metallo-hydrolase [Campylobacter sp. RM12321]
MKKVMDYFKEICAIPHASFQTDELKEYLLKHCEKCGFEAKVDEAGNIYAIKGDPKVCLQSHYDMVCVGDAPNLVLEQKDGFLRAKNSSLGADNGIGIAISMVMMEEFKNLEVIFTNNEEVGLWGAAKFNYKIKSGKVLNLDSEEDDRVSIGCAGSVDMYANKIIKKIPHNGFVYELNLSGFPGGHSGTQIDQNIPNAIKFLVKFIKENNGKISKFDGGERRNSIAANASAIAVFDTEIKNTPEYIKANLIGKQDCEIYDFSDDLLNMLVLFSQGVRTYNKELKIPGDSINLSTAKEKEGKFEVLFFARSMSKEGLENSKFETKTLCECFGFDFKFQNQTTPWNPQVNEFSEIVLKALKKYSPNAKFAAVHAGLECGVFIGKDESLLATSIGPNIFNPHSINEKVELKSVDIIEKAVKDILKDIGA